MRNYILKNVCPSSVDLEIADGIVKHIKFHGGCPGNLTAIARLLEGRPAEEIVEKLAGITCGNKPTSCADQLANVLNRINKT